MKPATLGQASKVLQLLESLSSEQVQQLLEGGVLSKAVEEMSGQQGDAVPSSKQIEERWQIIKRLTSGLFTDVVITVPNLRCPHRFGGQRYQVRCWGPGATYSPTQGHMDGGVDLFETFIERQLHESNWLKQFEGVGIDLSSYHKCPVEWKLDRREGYCLIYASPLSK